MGKKETKETYSSSKEAAGGVSGAYDPLQQESKERAESYNPGIGEQKEFLSTGFKNMMNDPSDISAREIQAQQVGFNRVADPRKTDVAGLKDSLEYYKTFRDTGGLSAENIERMRGMGGFDEFAKTGGYTPESLANIKSQAISPIGSYATGTRDELARRQAVQGGYAPGFDAANRQLQRDTARNIANTSLDANVMLQEKVNEGRRWGYEGLSGAEKSLADIQTRNKLEAAAGEAGINKSLAELDQLDIQNLMKTGMFNSEGELKAAIANQQASLAADQYNSQAGAMADMYNQQNAQDQYARGMAGLGGLYEGDVGLQQGEYDRQLDIQRAEDAARGGYLSNQGSLATQPGLGGNIIGAIGAGAGIATNFWNPAAKGIGGAGAPYDYSDQLYGRG